MHRYLDGDVTEYYSFRPTRGVNLDTPKTDLSDDFWSAGKNVQFRDGIASRILGSRIIYEAESVALSDLYHTLNVESADINWWLLFEKSGKAWAVSNGQQLQIDNLQLNTVVNPEQYGSTLINGVPIVTNGINEPLYWPGTGNLKTLPDWTATESCQVLATLKFHVFAMNLSGPGGEFPSLVKFSDATEPGSVPISWTPGPGSDAGFFELADSPGEILTALALGDSLYVYKRSATYQIQYQGGQNTFTQRRLPQGSSTGALTRRSVVDIGGQHFIVADGEVYLSNGVERRNIAEGRVRDYLFNAIDPANYVNLFCVYNRSRDEVFVMYPTTGNLLCNEALIYDVSTDSWSPPRDLNDIAHANSGLVSDDAPGNTWADRTEVWADAVGTWATGILSGAVDSLVFVEPLNLVEEDIATPTVRDATIIRTGLTLGAPNRYKRINGAFIRTRESFERLGVRVGGQDTPTGAVDWSPVYELASPEDYVPVIAQGKYIAIEISSNDAGVWKVPGVELGVSFSGEF